MRMSSYDDSAIVEELKLDISTVNNIEESTKRSIQNSISSGKQRLAEIASELGISPIIIDMFMSYYQIDIPESIPILTVDGDNGGNQTQNGVKTSRGNYRMRDRYVNAIREAYVGGDIIDDVIEKTGLSRDKVNRYAPEAGITFSKLERHKKKRSRAILQAIADGADSEDAVAKYLGLKVKTIREHAIEADIKLPGIDYRTREEKINAIKQAKDDGYKSIKSIAIEVRLTESLTYTLIKEGEIDLPGIGLPVRPGTKRRPEIDNLIERGMSLQEMRVELNKSIKISRERIRQYIIHSDQNPKWVEKKEEAEQGKKQSLENIIYILKTRVDELVKKESWAFQKAFEYMESGSKKSGVQFGTLITAFERLEKGANYREKIELTVIADGLNMHLTTLGRIFRAVGVESMYNSKQRNIPTEEKKEQIRRGYSLEMTVPDIGYFLEIPNNVVAGIFRKIGNRPRIKRYIARFGNKDLIYRLASQIYEAEDLKFKKNEIAKLLDTNKAVVDYATANREALQQKIIGVMRILYHDNSINKPYLKG